MSEQGALSARADDTAVDGIIGDANAPPPPALAARIRALIADRAQPPFDAHGALLHGDAALAAVDPLLRAGTDGLATLLHDGCTMRDSALDLLAVDALVTYAFEAASWDGAGLEARAAAAMARIAALTDEPLP